MVQSDAFPTSDQDVIGLISAASSNILSWRLIMKYFLYIFTRLLIQEGHLLVSDERMCTSTG